jgi:ribose 1,5-bisphosphate isomerase
LNAELERTISDIKALRIQGARNVARAAMQAMARCARTSKAATTKALMAELSEAADALAATRPTEPMMRNALDESLRRFFFAIAHNKKMTTAQLKGEVVRVESNFEKEFERSRAAIAEFGAKEIPKGATILTHCHSSTVTATLKRAHAMGTKINVICCETRPLYQGRITAKELSSAGIPTTLIVDSAARTFMRDADLALVGADAITSSANEVANPKDFPRVKIRNPAFDLTPARHITAYITEHGVVSPGSLFALASKHFELRNPMVKEGARRKR